MADAEVIRALRQYLTYKGLTPADEWWTQLVPTLRLGLPLVSLQKTVEYKIIASDITASLDKTKVAALPSNALDATVKEQRLPDPIVAQILDIEDIGRSRWSQVELLEQQERGEMTRGREIIRVVDEDSRDTASTAAAAGTSTSRGPHKLLLQDVKGVKLYAFELSPVTGLDSKTEIGAKLVVRQGIIARGMLLLEGRNVDYLGGKVSAWHEQWLAGRKEALKARISR